MYRMVNAFYLLISVLLLTPCPGYSRDLDLFDVQNVTNPCIPAIPTGLAVVPDSITTSSVEVSWSAVSASFLSYEIIYHSSGTTVAESVMVDSGVTSTVLTGLGSFTEYTVFVRVVCGTSEFGSVSDSPVVFETLPDRPDRAVTNLNVTVNANGISRLVYISWDHIPDDAWNGHFGGYLIYIYELPETVMPSATIQVNYPRNDHFKFFEEGEYGIQVFAFNQQGNQSLNSSVFPPFFVGGASSQATLEYPFAYIIVPGIVFLAIIIVVTVVIFKKALESRRSVTYCKDISNHKGYSNAIPLQERRSPSSSVSPGVLSPSVVVAQASFSNRPLPLSPSGPSPTRQIQQQRQQPVLEHEPPQFGNGMASNLPPAPKLPHPGPLPQLIESSEAGFVPMHRSMTNQSSGSVFSPTGAVFQHHQQPRQRSKTIGEGMPSPYEVPEHNGSSTLSRGDSSAVVRPASASAAQHRGVGQVHRGGNFPPPPAHSPPPLTHSSMELRARMGSREGMMASPPGQNTLPRSMSSSHQASGSAKTNLGGMKQIRSEGHFPIFESRENGDENKMVYIAPPLDSSVEMSIHSASSYGQNGAARRPSLDTAPYPYHGGLATNGSVETEHFNNFAERTDRSVLPPGIPRAPAHNPAYHERDRSVRSNGRESLFSETSIELSVSSSDREVSPQWDHRGAKSDVGVGNLSHSPEGRDAVSEVGAGYKPHPHHTFKQV